MTGWLCLLAMATWAAAPSPEVQDAARKLLAEPLPDDLPGPDAAEGQALWQRALAHPEWFQAAVDARLVWRDSWGPSGMAPIELHLAREPDRLAAVYLCLADDARAQARIDELKLVAEPARDCDLGRLLAPDQVLEQAQAQRATEEPFLDKHFRYLDLARCCRTPVVPRRLDCADCEHRDQLLMDARTADCLVYDQRETSIDPGFHPDWDGTFEEEPGLPSFRCTVPLPAPAGARAPQPCEVDDLLGALIDVEAALRAGVSGAPEGRRLIEATECQATVPPAIAARVLRAIGATQPQQERAAWWSAAWDLDPAFAYGVGEVPSELREAAEQLAPVPWQHLPLAQRLVEAASAQQQAVERRYPRTMNAYSWFPMPRVWGVGGVTTAGDAAHGIGGSIGAGSTFVGFAERSGGTTFVGAGTHSFVGDSYNHGSRDMMCRVLHRHYVRPGLLVGGVLDDGRWGARIRPEVSLGAYLNLLIAVPVTWQPQTGWSGGAQVGLALGVP